MKSLFHPNHRAMGLMFILLLNGHTKAENASGVVPQPVPSGFDFPAKQTDLEKLRDQQDVVGMRKHAWNIVAGITQLAPGGEAIWETWWTQEEVFTPGAGPQGIRTVVPKKFKVPRQFRSPKGGPAPQATGSSLAEFVLLNDDSRKFIRSNQYHLRATINQINANWPQNTPIADRKIKDFTNTSMSIKTAWYHVKAHGLTGMPIWDELPRQNTFPSLSPPTWPRSVAVDPSRDTIPAGETATVSRDGKPYPHSKVVPLKSFYHYKIDAATMAQLNQDSIFGEPVVEGDYLALVNLHFTTKEIPQWVWGTLWWHDQPDQAPFGADRLAEVKGPWRNYKMDVGFSMDLPKEGDGSAKVVFNPWLEGRFPNGANSNCMACHQQAIGSADDASFLPIVRGTMNPNDDYFKNQTKTDFLWSITLFSDPKPQ